MRSITYVSSTTQEMSSTDLKELLVAVRPQNEHRGITGMLLFRAGRIIQTLEGDDDNVMAVFDKIVDDPRHTDVFVIVNETVEEREFPDWSMAFRDVTDVPEDELPGYSRFLNDDRDSAFAGDATLTRRLFELFRATSN